MLARSQFQSDQEYLAALRDYFAAAALPGLLTGCTSEEGASTILASADESKVDPQVQIARVAYALADAMLAERRKP